MIVTSKHRFAVSVLVLLLAACTMSPTAGGKGGAALLVAAVDHADTANSFRVRGNLVQGNAGVQWEGLVVGDDEQYREQAFGTLLDHRRIDGVMWGRPLDRSRPWISMPSDGSFDLHPLLHGEVGALTSIDRRDVVELHFLAGEDVLKALTHIPSVGPSDATVTIEAGFISKVELRFPSGAAAEVDLWDYGAPLAVEPIKS